MIETIEETYLKNDYVDERRIKEAVALGIRRFCVLPRSIAQTRIAAAVPVKIVTVLGWPNGRMSLSALVDQTQYALDHGADCLDYVFSDERLKNGDLTTDIEWLRHLHDRFGCDQVNEWRAIIELPLLVKMGLDNTACATTYVSAITPKLMELGVTIKTGTGTYSLYHNVEETNGIVGHKYIELLKRLLFDNYPIKASGGIKTLERAKMIIEAGAKWIGTSSGVEIARERSVECVTDCGR